MSSQVMLNEGNTVRRWIISMHLFPNVTDIMQANITVRNARQKVWKGIKKFKINLKCSDSPAANQIVAAS